jgi:nitroimidazol reductase NimA-like FMN-containing flavoprotein (pyridoxamine 5'-phosphate oxidase superfamily)
MGANEGPDPTEDVGGEPMDDGVIHQFLHERGTGVLSLADDGEAYGIPISYGYDEEAGRIYFVFLRPGERSKKETFAERTERASLLVQAVDSPQEWQSVVASGAIHRTDDDERERAVEAIDEDAWYPNVFRESAPTRGIVGYVLDIEELTGRTGGGGPPGE